MLTSNMEQWLQDLPLDDIVDIDGESVFLNIQEGGAELGVMLEAKCSDRQVLDALHIGFQSALNFDAGLTLSAEGGELMLMQWLPGVEGWTDAAEALENILNQASMWRAAMAPVESKRSDLLVRDEERVRKMFFGERNEAA